MLVLIGMLLAPTPVRAQWEALVEARSLYNEGRLDEAIAAAAEVAAATPALESEARLVAGRARLERYRQHRDPADLAEGRLALLGVDVAVLEARSRTELLVGLAEALFLEGAYGAAAELFDSALDLAEGAGPAVRPRVLDWWATSLDRQAEVGDETTRWASYHRVLARMEEELREDPASGVAAYWVAAAARSLGDLDRAWSAAVAGWIRAPLTPDRGAALRADLDRLVEQGIIPDRVRRAPAESDAEGIAAVLRADWEAVKERWTARD